MNLDSLAAHSVGIGRGLIIAAITLLILAACGGLAWLVYELANGYRYNRAHPGVHNRTHPALALQPDDVLPPAADTDLVPPRTDEGAVEGWSIATEFALAGQSDELMTLAERARALHDDGDDEMRRNIDKATAEFRTNIDAAVAEFAERLDDVDRYKLMQHLIRGDLETVRVDTGLIPKLDMDGELAGRPDISLREIADQLAEAQAAADDTMRHIAEQVASVPAGVSV